MALLADSRVLVTGATGGVGVAIARRFCEEGARVVAADLDPIAVEDLAATLRSDGYEAHGVAFDVCDESAVEGGVSRAAESVGGLDVVVANAGILSVAPIESVDAEAFSRVLDVNLLGTFLTLRCGVEHLRAAGGGVLLSTASQAGTRGYARLSAYCASKFGVVGLVQALSQELAEDGIRVNCVAPGMIETSMLDQLITQQHGEGLAARVRGATPLGRPARPDEIANGLVYLASPLASYVSGVALSIDGGELSG